MIKRDSLFSEEDMTRSDRSLHTPGAFAKQNLLYVQEVGRLQSLIPHRCVRENLDSFLFLVVLEGKGSLDIEGKHYEVAQGDCALIDCMKHYEHMSGEREAWKLAWVHFNGHAARGYYELFMKYNESGNVFTPGETAAWDTLVGELLTGQKERNLQSELQCGELLVKLLNRIINSVANASVIESEQEKQVAGQLRELLNEKYAEADILQTVGNTFGESVPALEAQFTKKFGISIEEYISNRRLNAAKELLRFSVKSVEEIAEESGIGDRIVLQQMFRENEGMTAEEYRAKWAAWIR